MRTLRLTLMIVLLLVLTTMVAGADPPDPHPGPATFYDWPDCWVFDVQGEWYYIEDCSPTIAMETNGRIDVKHWAAKAQLPEDAALPDGKAWHTSYEDSGFVCWWDVGVETTKYSVTITPDGQFNISCHFRADKWQPE